MVATRHAAIALNPTPCRESIVCRPLAVSALLLLLGQGNMALAMDDGPTAKVATAVPAASAPAPLKGNAARPVPVPADAASATPASEMQVVNVVEQRAGVLAKIDRDVYDVKSNPATSNASAADILNNVPAVSVDSEGKVTLRGSSNVRIMVDGKPAAQFQGPNGGANLNSLPAIALESVEVISTPGAEFGTEGGGGPILNLVMKRVQPPGARATLNANLGAGGRYNTSGFGTYSNGRLSADTTISVRHDKQETFGEGMRRRVQDTQTIATHRNSAGLSSNEPLMLSSTLNYNLGDKERLVATAGLNRYSSNNAHVEHIVSIIDGASLPFEELERDSVSRSRNASRQLGVAYERKFDKPNEELRIDLRYSDNEAKYGTRSNNDYLIVPPGRSDAQTYSSSVSPTRILDLTADYSLPLTRMSAMKAGLKLARNRSERDQDYFAFDPLTGEEVFDTDRSSAFVSTEQTYALYASYDRWVTDRLTLRAGLRGEYTDLTMRYRQQQREVSVSNHYLMPNLVASYDFSKTNKLRLNFSQRVERPRAEDLNPFLLYRDQYNSSQGDPRLAPQKTRNYELGWDASIDGTRGSLRLTRSTSAPMFTRTLVPVPDSTTVIGQSVNFGRRQADTLSLNLSRNITPAWTANGTITVGYDEQSYLSNQRGADGLIHTQGLLLKGPRKQLQLNTTYRFSPGTSLSLMAMRRGSQVTPFGVGKPFGTSNINLSHALNSRVSLRLNLADAFEWSQFGWKNDTGIVSDQSWSRTKGRIAYVGLSITFGGVSGSAAVRNAASAPAQRLAAEAAAVRP